MINNLNIKSVGLWVAALIVSLCMCPGIFSAQVGTMQIITDDESGETIVLDDLSSMIKDISGEYDLALDTDSFSVVSGEFFLKDNEISRGDIFLVNSRAKIHGTIDGSLMAINTDLIVTGTVTGDLVGLQGSSISLGNTASIEGKLVHAGADIGTSDETNIGEQIYQTGTAEVSDESDFRFNFDTEELSSATFLGDLHVKSDEIRDGDVVIFGGSGLIEGIVKGNVLILGGDATISGKVTGDVVVFGGSIDLKETADIRGELVTFGGSATRAIGARIGRTADITSFQKVALIWWIMMTVFGLLLLNRPLSRASRVMMTDALRCVFTGFLLHCAILFLTIFLTITIIGLPLTLVTIVFWIAACTFGVLTGFVTLGQIIIEKLGKNPGMIFLSGFIGFLVLWICRYIPFGFGFIIWHVWAMAGIGATILSRFGTMKPWFRRSDRLTRIQASGSEFPVQGSELGDSTGNPT